MLRRHRGFEKELWASSIIYNDGALPKYMRTPPISAIFEDDETEEHPPILFAIIGTWREFDIIEATVKNCFAQGCSKVFIVDNASPDATREIAAAAGASVIENYYTDFYDDDRRILLMNEHMQRITQSLRLPNLWWLILDADEFPCVAGRQRLLDYLKTVHPQYNCMGGWAVDLYPTRTPAYIPGMHPADCMPFGIPRQDDWCGTRHHWKHSLLRSRGGQFNICISRGMHIPYVRPYKNRRHEREVMVIEPPDDLYMFHAPIRAEEHTFARLKALCDTQGIDGKTRDAADNATIGKEGSIKRWRTLQHVYAQEWHKVELPHTQRWRQAIVGIAPLPWRSILTDVKTFPRWYPEPKEQGDEHQLPRKTAVLPA